MTQVGECGGNKEWVVSLNKRGTFRFMMIRVIKSAKYRVQKPPLHIEKVFELKQWAAAAAAAAATAAAAAAAVGAAAAAAAATPKPDF